MNKYPLGLQTFEKIINKNLLYIDKTKDIYHLTELRRILFLCTSSKIWKVLNVIYYQITLSRKKRII